LKSVVILISGRGSNMRSIVEAGTGLEVKAVISNRPAAPGLDWARSQGIPAIALDHKAHPTREDFDARLAAEIDRLAPDFVLLAGFMRILTPDFIARYPRRILNIHPSLLPSFPGLHTHRRALEAGVKLHGCTVHVVTPALDNGPIVVQAAVPVMRGDTEGTLAERVLAAEHRIYPQAVRWLVDDRIEFLPGRGREAPAESRGREAPAESRGREAPAESYVVQVRDSGVSTDSIVSPRESR
jgi:phosphoribosylglycinamide formyltransferase-1